MPRLFQKASNPLSYTYIDGITLILKAYLKFHGTDPPPYEEPVLDFRLKPLKTKGLPVDIVEGELVPECNNGCKLSVPASQTKLRRSEVLPSVAFAAAS